MVERVFLYDSTLRDGAQTQGVDFSAADKSNILSQLDDIGIDYVEGGWPGANPTDDAFFADKHSLKNTKLTAFGMTRRANTSPQNDSGLNMLINSGVEQICIVGKSWDFHVINALGITLEKNMEMVASSIKYLTTKVDEVLFDAEHFFDGYKANPKYATKVIRAAYDAGAKWIVLCDTNGGTLPFEIYDIVKKVTKVIPSENIGIHCHNDTENAVANSIEAVRAGARQVQGTIGGYGERCGNANLISLIPTLSLKMGYDVGISKENIKCLKKISDSLDDLLNRPRYKHAAYVGKSAFAHKGGLHVSAVVKNPTAYEHIKPEDVGNERLILISDQAGRSNIVNRLASIGYEIDLKNDSIRSSIDALVEAVKERENKGYAYDGADASFEILAKRYLGEVPNFFDVKRFTIVDNRSWGDGGELTISSEATVVMEIAGKEIVELENGNGPVNALNKALKKGLIEIYPEVENNRLTDYQVRIVTPERGTEAVTRVQIETTDDEGNRWSTVGVSANIIDASYNALYDAIVYRLLNSEIKKIRHCC